MDAKRESPIPRAMTPINCEGISNSGRSTPNFERGRPSYPRRSYEYSSLRNVRSTNVTPDLITRTVSPGRSSLENNEVHARIPQMYRTSFSAVTSPVRVNNSYSNGSRVGSSSPSPGGSPLRKTPLRATMPSRVMSPERERFMRSGGSPRRQFVSPERLGSNPNVVRTSSRESGISEPKGILRSSLRSTSASPARPPSAPNPHTRTAVHPRSRSVEGRGDLRLRSRSNDRSEDGVFMNGVHDVTSDTLDSVFSDGELPPLSPGVITNGSTDFSLDGDSRSRGRQSSQGSLRVEGEVQSKKMVEKEYVHHHVIQFGRGGKLPKPDETTNKLAQDIMTTHITDGLSEPCSPFESPPGRQSRSSTLPSDEVHKQLNNVPVRKSLSSSITNFFRKMSPKSPRKQSKTSDRLTDSPLSSSNSLYDTPGDSQSGSDTPSTPTHKNKSFRGPKSSPLKLFKSKKNKDKKDKSKDSVINQSKTPNGASDSNADKNAVQPDSPQSKNSNLLPPDSQRLLRSIGDNNQTSGDIYQNFKKKHSPNRITEATSLKPQALRAVEFPDQPCDDDKTDGATKQPHEVTPQFRKVTRMDESVTTISTNDSLQTLDSIEESGPLVSRQGPNLTPVRKSSEPPRSLNVREVAKLSKNTFEFPCMSVESIGPCSLDLSKTGSEPSLAGSRNGHRSASVMASKQSIISRDSVSPMRNTPGGSTDASSVDATQQGEPVVGNTSPLPSTPKTPSYLRLSCINSGYSRYSGYGSPREMARIRVIKKSEHNSSLSSVSSSSTSIGSTEAAGQESDSTSRMTLTQGHPDPKGHDQLGQGQQNGDLPTSDPDTSGQASLNGLDNVDSSKVLKQREKTENQKSDVVKQTPLNGHESADLKINLNAETTPPQTRKDQSRKDSLSVSPSKDGNYYIKLMENTAEQLRSLANVSEKDLEKNLPEEASGKLRAAVGKVNLLITKKFKQFRGLCEQNLNQSEEESFRTTNQDLAGFWDMVLLQVEDLDSTFKEIDKIRNNNWQMSPVHVKKPERPMSASRMKSPRTKDSTPKSAKSIEMQRQREEARRRLLEAKKKGRERKASQSKDDEIEIFVPQD